MRTLGNRSSVLSPLLIMTACASGGSAPATTVPATEAQDQATLSARTRTSEPIVVFSRDQADRGRATFRAVCAECHYSSEFRGTHFQFSWRRRSVADFFEQISSTMPEDAPGSLSPTEYLDVVTYVLQLNGFQAGEAELPLDLAVLEAQSMAAPPVAGGSSTERPSRDRSWASILRDVLSGPRPTGS
jgi:mono/diheme cytochrome c family protein